MCENMEEEANQVDQPKVDSQRVSMEIDEHQESAVAESFLPRIDGKNTGISEVVLESSSPSSETEQETVSKACSVNQHPDKCLDEGENFEKIPEVIPESHKWDQYTSGDLGDILVVETSGILKTHEADVYLENSEDLKEDTDVNCESPKSDQPQNNNEVAEEVPVMDIQGIPESSKAAKCLSEVEESEILRILEDLKKVDTPIHNFEGLLGPLKENLNNDAVNEEPDDSGMKTHEGRGNVSKSSSIPCYSLPKPQEYGSFKSTVTENLKIRGKKSSNIKNSSKNAEVEDTKEDEIICLGLFIPPKNMNPGSSMSSCAGGSSDNTLGYSRRRSSVSSIDAAMHYGPFNAGPSSTMARNAEAIPYARNYPPNNYPVHFPSSTMTRRAVAIPYGQNYPPNNYPFNVPSSAVSRSAGAIPFGQNNPFNATSFAMARRAETIPYGQNYPPSNFSFQVPSSTMVPRTGARNNVFTGSEAYSSLQSPDVQQSRVSETPGLKRGLLKKNLMEKMKASREQKFLRQKEEEKIDKEEIDSASSDELNLNSSLDLDNPDSDDYIGKLDSYLGHRDSDSPLFCSLPSYQPGGGFKSPEEDNLKPEKYVNDGLGDGHDYDKKEYNDMEKNDNEEYNDMEKNDNEEYYDMEKNDNEEYNDMEKNDNEEGSACENDEGSLDELKFVKVKYIQMQESSENKSKECTKRRNSIQNFDEDSITEICSGVFPATLNSEHDSENSVASFISSNQVVESTPIKNTGSNFPKKRVQSLSRQTKRKIFISSSDESEDDSQNNSHNSSKKGNSPIFTAKSKNKRSKKKHYLSDSECEDEGKVEKEIPMLSESSKSAEDQKSKRQLLRELFEEEAELSGEEASSDENEDELSGDEEDDEDIDVPESELHEMGKIHLKKINQDDDQLLKKIKNDFLEEGDCYNENGERVKKFQWSTPSTSRDVVPEESSDSEEENKVHLDQEKLKWLKESSANAPADVPCEQLSNKSKLKLNILSKIEVSGKQSEAKKKKKVRGSFLKQVAGVSNVPKDTDKKGTPKGHFFGTAQKPPKPDSL